MDFAGLYARLLCFTAESKVAYDSSQPNSCAVSVNSAAEIEFYLSRNSHAILSMRYLIYCDESEDKGPFYGNFYGGALVRENDRERVNERLDKIKTDHKIQGEMKWTKICDYNESAYISFVDEVFNILDENIMKMRIMFTQNINRKDHIEYEPTNEFLVLYYQFLKHAFGLRYCNPLQLHTIHFSVYLDEVPTKREDFATFKRYLSSLSDFPVFNRNKIQISYDDITDVDSKKARNSSGCRCCAGVNAIPA